MPFVIETHDFPGRLELRERLRPAHLQFLAERANALLACGAKLTDDGGDAGGGFYILDVLDRAAAQSFIEQDPFAEGGLFEKVTITHWRQAYLAGRCHLSAEDPHATR